MQKVAVFTLPVALALIIVPWIGPLFWTGSADWRYSIYEAHSRSIVPLGLSKAISIVIVCGVLLAVVLIICKEWWHQYIEQDRYVTRIRYAAGILYSVLILSLFVASCALIIEVVGMIGSHDFSFVGLLYSRFIHLCGVELFVLSLFFLYKKSLDYFIGASNSVVIGNYHLAQYIRLCQEGNISDATHNLKKAGKYAGECIQYWVYRAILLANKNPNNMVIDKYMARAKILVESCTELDKRIRESYELSLSEIESKRAGKWENRDGKIGTGK